MRILVIVGTNNAAQFEITNNVAPKENINCYLQRKTVASLDTVVKYAVIRTVYDVEAFAGQRFDLIVEHNSFTYSEHNSLLVQRLRAMCLR